MSMFLTLIAILPFLFAAAAFACGRRVRLARSILGVCAVANFALVLTLCVAAACSHKMSLSVLQWLPVDSGRIQGAVMFSTAALFLFAALYSVSWLAADAASHAEHVREKRMRENVFCCLLCAFAGAMNLVIFSENAGFMWVAMEATTLLSAPLIIFHRNPKTVGAMWKYIMACSVGIGFALFGTMLAARAAPSGISGLNLPEMAACAELMDPFWIKAAFVFILAGYGTKMGLAPFHAWIQTAYPAAPAPATAFMSGALVNCSFLAIWRFYLMAPPPVQELSRICRSMMIALGLVSLAVAAVNMLKEKDCARMLAHSSVEQMGLVIIMAALDVSILSTHLIVHAFLKCALFMIVGCILISYKSRSATQVRGMFGRNPFLATLWIGGIFALCAMPPSPLFFTELALIREAGLLLGGVILFFLFVIFCAMSKMALSMTMGEAQHDSQHEAREKSVVGWKLLAAPTALIVFAFVAGIAWRFA